MSAKALGQIHTVNFRQAITGSSFPDDVILMDIPGQLTQQLQTLVRCGTYQKVVGIDMSLDTVGIAGGGQISGRIRYYAPTKGRCAAFRGAFQAMKNQMKTQGVTTMSNALYDFKAPINNNIHQSGDFPNQATLDGTGGLALYDSVRPGLSIFDVHNRNVQPEVSGMPAGDAFSPGFNTLTQNFATGTDFVLNDAIPYSGNRDTASVEYEEIPFMLSWTPDSSDLSIDWQWRPDPALFLAVLCGQMSLVIEEMELDGGNTQGLNLNVAVMVSGWKSIMGDPSKKRSKRKSSSKKKGSQ